MIEEKSEKNRDDQTARHSLPGFSRTHRRDHFVVPALQNLIGKRSGYICTHIPDLGHQNEVQNQQIEFIVIPHGKDHFHHENGGLYQNQDRQRVKKSFNFFRIILCQKNIQNPENRSKKKLNDQRKIQHETAGEENIDPVACHTDPAQEGKNLFVSGNLNIL